MKRLIYKGSVFLLLAGAAVYFIHDIVEYNSKRYISTEELGFDKPGEFFKYFRGIATPIGSDRSGYSTNYRFREFNKAKVRLKKPPTFLPLSSEAEALAIKIKLKGIIAAAKIPAKTLAVKSAYILGARAQPRLAKEKAPRE